MSPVEGTITAYIGLGANVGASWSTLEHAATALDALPEASLRGVSRLYRTRPVGPVEQDDFLNAVVALSVSEPGNPGRGAMALLVALKGIERALGREDRERWGPRELDLDLLLYGRHELHVERQRAAHSKDPTRSSVQWLDVPHVSAGERLFVLAPLADLAPTLRPPGWDRTVAEAMAVALRREGAQAVRPVAAWDPDTRLWAGQRSPGDAASGERMLSTDA